MVRNDAGHASRAAAQGFNAARGSSFPDGRAPQPRPVAFRRPNGDEFENHLHGVVDLEGEHSDDDERGQAIHAQQMDFLRQADYSRRQEHQLRRPSAPREALI